jgi:hypothetical protein
MRGRQCALIKGKSASLRAAQGGRPSTRWETIMGSVTKPVHREPWNRGKIVGQKARFKLKDIWVLRFRLLRAWLVDG